MNVQFRNFLINILTVHTTWLYFPLYAHADISNNQLYNYRTFLDLGLSEYLTACGFPTKDKNIIIAQERPNYTTACNQAFELSV